jgi:predicted transcriptional regulator
MKRKPVKGRVRRDGIRHTKELSICYLTMRGWRQSEIADALGMTQSYVSTVLRGLTDSIDIVREHGEPQRAYAKRAWRIIADAFLATVPSTPRTRCPKLCADETSEVCETGDAIDTNNPQGLT